MTLVEVLVVIVVVAVLVALLLTGVSAIRARTKMTLCASQLRQIGQAIETYKSQFNCVLPYPMIFERDINTTGMKSFYFNALRVPQGLRVCPTATSERETISYAFNSTLDAELGFVGFRRFPSPAAEVVVFVENRPGSNDETAANEMKRSVLRTDPGRRIDWSVDRHGRLGSNYLFADLRVSSDWRDQRPLDESPLKPSVR